MAVPGVVATEVGYAGGWAAHPTYAAVCRGDTGHAEVVRVTFDPAVVSYRTLLDVFFSCHDPCLVNRQGPDIGSQYRSIILCQSPEQRKEAEACVQTLAASPAFRGKRIATQIVEETRFTRAEEEHQQYVARRGESFCRFLPS